MDFLVSVYFMATIVIVKLKVKLAYLANTQNNNNSRHK